MKDTQTTSLASLPDWWDDPPLGTCEECRRLDYRAIRRVNRRNAPVLCDRCFDEQVGTKAAKRHRCTRPVASESSAC